uniref:Uncharacterized protein n=1 Tax=Populus trichocarpa TaxID=3694 RepID=U5G182_POPTR
MKRIMPQIELNLLFNSFSSESELQGWFQVFLDCFHLFLCRVLIIEISKHFIFKELHFISSSPTDILKVITGSSKTIKPVCNSEFFL